MNGYLKLNNITLGEVDLKIIDESMGVIGGSLKPYQEYFNYQNDIQIICDKKGIANIDDYQFKIDVPNIIKIEDGIGITDIRGIAEVVIEIVALPFEVLTKFV